MHMVKGFMAASKAAQPPISEIMYVNNGVRSSPGSISLSLSAFPHIAGLKRFLVFQATGLRTDTSNCLFNNLSMTGGTRVGSVQLTNSNVGGIAAGATLYELADNTTSVSTTTSSGNTSHVCHAIHGIYADPDTEAYIVDYDFSGGSGSNYGINFDPDPLLECYTFCMPTGREGGTSFGGNVGWQVDVSSRSHTSNGKSRIGHTPEAQVGSNIGYNQNFSGHTRALMQGIMVGFD